MNELCLHKWNPLTNALELVEAIRDKLIHYGSAPVTDNDPADCKTSFDSPLGLRACEFALMRLSMLTELPNRSDLSEALKEHVDEKETMESHRPRLARQVSLMEQKFSQWGRQKEGVCTLLFLLCDLLYRV